MIRKELKCPVCGCLIFVDAVEKKFKCTGSRKVKMIDMVMNKGCGFELYAGEFVEAEFPNLLGCFMKFKIDNYKLYAILLKLLKYFHQFGSEDEIEQEPILKEIQNVFCFEYRWNEEDE